MFNNSTYSLFGPTFNTIATKVLPAYDVVATGGVDDLVKVWQYEDGELRLRHKLGDHSLGVVSVALSKEAKYLGRGASLSCDTRHVD